MYNLADKIKYHLCSTLYECEPSSIAYRYINSLNFQNLNTGSWRDFYNEGNSVELPDINFSLLRSIVDEQKIPIPENNAFAIHLRLGDKIGDPTINNLKSLLYKLIDERKLNLKYSLCRVYYGNHNGVNHKKSLEVIDGLKSLLHERFLINLQLISDKVDVDFCNLCNEPCMIPTTGGFSWPSASINPNNVIWDIFDGSSYHPNDHHQIQSGKFNQLKIQKLNECNIIF